MVRKPIEQFLTAVYGLPVAEDIENTEIERAVGYSLQQNKIDIRVLVGVSITFDFSFSIFIRSSKDKPAIGLITRELTLTNRYPKGFNIKGLGGGEFVAWENNTHQIITKTVHAFITQEWNSQKDIITDIEIIPPPVCNGPQE
jgi:hypothetical protein